MKPFHLILGLFLVSGASAQTPTTTSPASAPATVVQKSWRQEVFVPTLYDDPMRINQDQDDLLRDQRATAKENANRARTGQDAIPLPTKKVASNTPVGSTPMGTPIGDEPVGNKNLPAQEDPGSSSLHYVYEATIKNTGEKTIRSVIWQYALFETDTDVPVGTHRFNSAVKIRPGKTAKVVGRSKTPPAKVVRASDKSGKEPEKYSERVVIEEIQFDDGTAWRIPN